MLEILTLAIGIAGILGWSVIRPAVARLWYGTRGKLAGGAVGKRSIEAVNKTALESIPSAGLIEMPIRFESLADTKTRQDPAAAAGWAPEEFTAQLGPGLHALIGDGGVGKSHAMAAVTRILAAETNRIVINLPVEMLASIDDLETTYLNAIDPELFALLKDKGHVTFIVDAIDQLSAEKKNNAVVRLRHLTNKYPSATVLFSCRRSGFPPQLELVTRRFTLRPPNRQEAETYIRESVEAAGISMPEAIPEHLWSLCNTPLLLTMLAAILTDNGNAKLPETLTQLYGRFLDYLYDREEDQFSFTLMRRHREALLSYMAFQKGGGGTQFTLQEVEAMVDAFLRNEKLPTMSGAETFMREVPGHPPFEAASSSRTAKVDSYFHHSVLEYYCACWIHRSVPEEAQIDLVLRLAKEPAEKFWPSIVFYSGFLNPADTLIAGLTAEAESQSSSVAEQRLFRLAALCASQSTVADRQTLDSLVIAILVAFKFGTVSFNQELVETLQLVGAERRSSGFPKRITEDIEYWIDKYARVRTFAGTTEEDISSLAEALGASDPALVCDALVQLTTHDQRARCTTKLVELIDSPYAMVREQAISAIGHMPGADINVSRALSGILFDPKHSAHEKALAMLSCGRLGLKDAFSSLERYLREPENPFRENASWAIYGLLTANPDDQRMRKRAQLVFAETLTGPGSRYCMANTLYCLSSLGMHELAGPVADWHHQQTDPHILEDSYIALGKIGNPEHDGIFQPGFSHQDPLVRYAALTGCRIFLDRHPEHPNGAALIEQASALKSDASIVVRAKAEAITLSVHG